jgi:transglutaminase-like putative cysteine protease
MEGATLPDWLSISASPERGLAALPVDAYALSAEREQTLRERGDSHVDLLRRVELHVRASGEIVQRSFVVRRFLTADGLQQFGNMQLGVRPTFEELSVEAAAVRQPDGRLEWIDPGTIQITDGDPAELFSDAKDVVVPFPNLHVGSTGVIAAIRTLHPERWPLPWSQTFSVRGLGSVERFEVQIEWDEGVEAPQWWTNDSRVLCKKRAERSVGCARYAVEPFRLDPDVASWGDLQSYVVVSRRHTWNELAEIERDVVWNQVDATPIAAIGADSGTPAERLARIYRFVADEVRYVPIEHGTRAVVPRRASETLALRYGDCKDKVTLFLALAREAGLDAYPVLVGSRIYDPERLGTPSWQWFDHMLACARGFGSEPVCLELTTPDAGVGELPSNLHGAVALALSPREDGAPARPAKLGVPSRSWPVRATVVNRIDCSGSIDEEVTLRFQGASALSLRGALRSLNQADRIRWAEETYEEAMGEAPKPTFSFAGLDSPGSEIAVTSRNRFERGSPLSEMPEITEPDVWLRYLSIGFNTANRHNPYRLVGVRVQSEVRYELCDVFVARHSGARLDFQSEFGSLTRAYEQRGSTAEVNTTLDLGPRTVSPVELDRLRHFMERTLLQTPIWIGLGKASP